MNLQQILDLTDTNRNTFNSWKRTISAGIPDQDASTGSGIDSGDDTPPFHFLTQRLRSEGRDRFTFSHAVGLACLKQFLDMGVPLRRAASVVSEMFNFIDDRVNSPRDEATWITYVDHGPLSWGFSGGYGKAEDQWDLSAEKERISSAVIRYSIDIEPILRRLEAQEHSGAAASSERVSA
jgi:hypothetical protein